MVWNHYGVWHLIPMGKPDEAVALMQKALAMDPLSPVLRLCLGIPYLMARKYDQAIEQFRNAMELDPHYGPSYPWLGYPLMMKGKLGEAAKEIETAAQLMGRSPLCLGMLGLAYGRAARISEAQKVLAELQDLAQKTYVSPFNFVPIYLGLGEMDLCFDWLEKFVEEQDLMAFTLPFQPIFDLLRSHPRYRALLQKMSFIAVIIP